MCILKSNQLMLFTAITTTYCQNHTKYTNTLCQQNAKGRYININIKERDVRLVTTVLLNLIERKVYRGILGLVYDNKKENWRILTNKEIYAKVKKDPL